MQKVANVSCIYRYTFIKTDMVFILFTNVHPIERIYPGATWVTEEFV